MKLGRQVGLPKKGVEPPFSAHTYSGQTAGWIKMPLGMELGVGPDGGPAPSPKKGHSLPNFRPMSIVAKRSPISTTAEHLLSR